MLLFCVLKRQIFENQMFSYRQSQGRVFFLALFTALVVVYGAHLYIGLTSGVARALIWTGARKSHTKKTIKRGR